MIYILITVVVGLFSFVLGYLTSVYTSPKFLTKKFNKILDEYKANIEAETRKQEAAQKEITERYQKAVQNAIYEHIMATGEIPAHGDMN